MLRQSLRGLHFPGIGPRKPPPGALAAMILAAFILSVSDGRAEGGRPLDCLRQGIEEGLRILSHPDFAAEENKPRQRERLRELLHRMFDFNEFSRRVLAENWSRFTPGERTEFVDVFAAFLAKYYLVRLQANYTDEKVVAVGQELTAHDRAVVKIAVLWRHREIPVEVRMHRRGPGWKAYDVSRRRHQRGAGLPGAAQGNHAPPHAGPGDRADPPAAGGGVARLPGETLEANRPGSWGRSAHRGFGYRIRRSVSINRCPLSFGLTFPARTTAVLPVSV